MTISELAAHLNGVVEGDGALPLSGVAALRDAVAGDVSFLANPKYANEVATSKASVILVASDWQGEHSAALIRVADPNKAFAQAVPFFVPPPVKHLAGIHPTAVIGDGVVLGDGCSIGPYVVIAKDCVLGARCILEAHVVLGEGCRLGDDVHLYPHVSVRERVKMGNRVAIHNGSVIGSDGYGYSVSMDAQGRPVIEKIPQLGTVELADDVEIGANVTIDRARFGATRIGRATKIDNLVQIGHNVQVGECSGLIAQSGIAGSTHVGNGVTIWAQAGLSGHLNIGDRSHVRPQAGVKDDVPPGGDVIGAPAVSFKDFAKQLVMIRYIEKLRARVNALEAEIKKN